MSNYPKVILNFGKEQSLQRQHPWVFSGAIKKIEGEAEDGDVVEVYSSRNEFLGMGHCQQGSIAVRLFSFEQATLNVDFWKKKIQRAYDYRTKLGLTNTKSTNVYRLVYAEGDGMPGLIIDYYNGTAVMQAHTVGMFLHRDDIVAALKEVMGGQLKAVYDKSEETLPKPAELDAKNGYLFGNTGLTEVVENGHKFLIDWEHGQKTGFFVDQRENRELLAKYCKDKTVANTFCYTGGFSVYAMNAGAKEVHSVDSSKKAIELTDKNIQLNTPGAANHASFAMDTFEFLKDKENVYDVIILDPPAFAKHREAKHNAVMGYKRLNSEAFRKIRPGGILFTFSCSQVVDRNTFNSTVMAAAITVGRNVRIMHHLSQPPDHPVSIYHPEGEYLKGLVVYVE